MALQALMVFAAQMFTVLLLGFQSKLMRDNLWKMCMLMSFLITLAQSATMWAIANNHLGMPLFLMISGAGGSIGIGMSHFAYHYYDTWRNKCLNSSST